MTDCGVAVGALRAVRVHGFGAPDALTLDEGAVPTPGAGEVRIAVAAAGLNFPDLLVAAGTYQALPELPFTLGMEAAGVVSAVGEGISGLSVGDRVLALVPHGAFADWLVVAADRVFPVPGSMPLTVAAGFGLAFATAFFGLARRADLRAGDTVLVTGVSGGVGAAAAAIAAARGARVIGATRDAATAASIVGETVDAFVSSDPARLRSEVLTATDGRGADIVFDVVGGEVLAQALRCVAWEGRAVVVGFASGGQPAIKPGHLLVKNIAVAGLQITDYLDRMPGRVREALCELGEEYADGRLRVPSVRTYPLEAARTALEDLREGRIAGKAVLLMSGSDDERSTNA